MNLLKLSSAVALTAALVAPAAPAGAAGVTFLSRSGQQSYFAAGVHGYPSRELPRPRVIRDEVPRAVILDDDRPRVWRETSRLDYPPPRTIRHGDRLDVLPGHYHYHSTGYWD